MDNTSWRERHGLAAGGLKTVADSLRGIARRIGVKQQSGIFTTRCEWSFDGPASGSYLLNLPGLSSMGPKSRRSIYQFVISGSHPGLGYEVLRILHFGEAGSDP
jgi:hypothetical protein